MTAVFNVLLLTSTEVGENLTFPTEARTKYDKCGKEIILVSPSSAKSSVLEEAHWNIVGGAEATTKNCQLQDTDWYQNQHCGNLILKL